MWLQDFVYTSLVMGAYPYIAFEGPIAAGKTTLATLLADHIGSQLVLEEFDARHDPTRSCCLSVDRAIDRSVQHGPELAGANSSARISEIEDVRAVLNTGTGTYQSYTFTYNTDAIPPLTHINNML